MPALSDKPADRILLAYLVFALLALAHLLVVLSYTPLLIPYVSDDMWMAWAGLHTPLKQFLMDCWISTKGMGRLALYLQYVISGLAFRYPAAAYGWQAFPLLMAIIAGAAVMWRYTQSVELALSLFILMGLGSFVTEPHHLFASYPAAFPIALTCSFGYLMMGIYGKPTGWGAVVRLLLFIYPLFNYEAFFPVQITAMLVIAYHRGSLKYLLPDAFLLGAIIVGYGINAHQVKGPGYQGTVLAHSFAAMPYTFLKYATGFLVLPMPLEAVVLGFIVGWFGFSVKQKSLPYAALGGYFLVLWLAPPWLLSITPKYQNWAQKTNALGSPVYVTTFLSEMGCFGLLILLLHTRGRTFQLIAVIFISLFMWASWHGETERVIAKRLVRFAPLDAAIAIKKQKGEINCFTIAETRQLLLPWEYCEYDNACRDETPWMLEQRGSHLCDTSREH